MYILFFLLLNHRPNKSVHSSSTYRSATLYLEPSFSNSAITQSVIQGTPSEVTTTKRYTICVPKLYTMLSVSITQQKQDTTNLKQGYNEK